MMTSHVILIQSIFVISTSLISNNRLSRSEDLVPGILTAGDKILWETGTIRSNFSPFPQYFQYISIFRVNLHIHL